ncbi:hypothetical protein pb186bvf_000304 [Paramecium bursaria]
MQALMNCFQHNQKSQYICTKQECPHQLACQNCLTSEHMGHVDTHIVPIKNFKGKLNINQGPEVERLKKVLYKDDLVLHVQREFNYLREKVDQILKSRLQTLIQLIESQWIHSGQLKNIIDHVELMRENKIYEEGLKVVLPILKQGVQDTISKFEKQKIRLVMKVKDHVNHVKTVLDGLFHVGNQYQLDQHQIKVKELQSASERDLKQQEDRLFNSAVLTSRPKEPNPSGTYQQFVDELFPQSQQDYIQVYNSYPLMQFQYKQEQFERTEQCQLYGVLDHHTYVYSAYRMRNGTIITCAKVVSFFEYPSLKLIQQIAHNQGVQQIQELNSNLLIFMTLDSIQIYERRLSRWIPKGELITPSSGRNNKILIKEDLFLIAQQTKLLLYRIKPQQQLNIELPIDFMFISMNPIVFQHKYDCSAFELFEGNTRMYSADNGGRLYRWKVNNNFSVETVIQASQSEIIGIAPLNDGRSVTVSNDGFLRLWENSLTQTTAISTIKHRSHIISFLNFPRDLDCFFTGDQSGKIQKWNVTVLIEPVFELDCHTDAITHLSFNQYLITCSGDKKAKVWVV